MLDFISSHILSVIFVFGTVVIIHELGHFAVAKLLKIRVEAFAVGFGPTLFGFRKGETEYKVCAIPLGGYVKMTGENPGEDLTGSIEEFLSRPKWQRFLVAVMGPVMNILLAVLLLAGVYYFKYEEPAILTQPVVAGIVQYESPAEKAGIQPGDSIVAVNGQRNPNWDQFLLEVMTSADRPMQLEILRLGKTIHQTITPQAQGREHRGYLGVFPATPPFSLLVVKRVSKGKPAEVAGILPGDKIIKVGNVDLIKAGKDLQEVLKRNPDTVVELTVLRNGQEQKVQVKPYKEGDRRLIGIELDSTQQMIVKTLSLGQAFKESIDKNIQIVSSIFDILQRLFKREVSLRMLEGPIGIARHSGLAAESGFSDLLMLMAFISLNLGIMNLLPIPVLDGGVIAIILLETVIRRDLTLPIRERITQVGFVMLILLAVVVTYNDIIRTLPASLGKYFP
ncbi:MAG: RIP metalloprotease RseP [Acidobacteria bacterium]|nr:RIP metalloprotease RseP [Acidobacteriota bacterium]MCI0628384.1 RIP metalloprotease RseP [Acidobacteriota bacterium]MCI0718935.1 RIP metalloprotease RseP [Acidobacteriota bacterium]